MSADLFARLMQVDRVLVSKGWHALSPWWVETFKRLIGRKVRRWVIRAGRRSGKSSSLCRFAVCTALFGEHVVQAGDLGIVAIVSVDRSEAAGRLKTIGEILRALGVPFTPRGDTIELVGKPIAFRVFTASISGSVGFTSIAVLADEVAVWQSADSGANPAKEVLGSLAPTMATMPNAVMVLSSSPFSTLDSHHEAFQRGETDDQATAFAPSWVANPTLSEAETHRLEPDPETWRRHYAAEPLGANGITFFNPDAVDAAVDAGLSMPLRVPAGAAVGAGVDPAFKKDAFAGAFVAMREGVVTLLDLVEVRPSPGSPLQPSVVCGAFASRARGFGCTSITSDGHYVESVREAVTAAGLTLSEIPGGIEGKTKVFTRARELLNTSKLVLPANAGTLVRSLKEITARPTSGGQIAITAPRRLGNHGDTVSALVAAVWGVRVSAVLPSAGLDALEHDGRRDFERDEENKPRGVWGAFRRDGGRL